MSVRPKIVDLNEASSEVITKERYLVIVLIHNNKRYAVTSSNILQGTLLSDIEENINKHYFNFAKEFKNQFNNSLNKIDEFVLSNYVAYGTTYSILFGQICRKVLSKNFINFTIKAEEIDIDPSSVLIYNPLSQLAS